MPIQIILPIKRMLKVIRISSITVVVILVQVITAVALFGTGRDTIQDHLVKADFVPVVFRVLLPENQIVFLSVCQDFSKSSIS